MNDIIIIDYIPELLLQGLIGGRKRDTYEYAKEIEQMMTEIYYPGKEISFIDQYSGIVGDVIVKIDGKEISVEVKCDFESNSTGNIFIETSYKKNKSGIYAALEQNIHQYIHIAFINTNKIIIINMTPQYVFDEILSLPIKKVYGGDNNDACGRLVKISDIREKFKI